MKEDSREQIGPPPADAEDVREDKLSPAAQAAADAEEMRRAPRYRGTIIKSELLRPGGMLLALLGGRAYELGHSRTATARHLGVTYGYIAQLAGGHRKPENISPDFSAACARYLGVPRLTVMMAAGVLSPDEAVAKPDALVLLLAPAMRFIAQDPVYGPRMPQELLSPDTSPSAQYLIIRLYEKATGRRLILEQGTPTELAGRLQRAAKQRPVPLRPATPHKSFDKGRARTISS